MMKPRSLLNSGSRRQFFMLPPPRTRLEEVCSRLFGAAAHQHVSRSSAKAAASKSCGQSKLQAISLKFVEFDGAGLVGGGVRKARGEATQH